MLIHRGGYYNIIIYKIRFSRKKKLTKTNLIIFLRQVSRRFKVWIRDDN